MGNTPVKAMGARAFVRQVNGKAVFGKRGEGLDGLG
jgi:hypothetical protein